jgi:hypothetical protein
MSAPTTTLIIISLIHSLIVHFFPSHFPFAPSFLKWLVYEGLPVLASYVTATVLLDAFHCLFYPTNTLKQELYKLVQTMVQVNEYFTHNQPPSTHRFNVFFFGTTTTMTTAITRMTLILMSCIKNNPHNPFLGYTAMVPLWIISKCWGGKSTLENASSGAFAIVS